MTTIPPQYEAHCMKCKKVCTSLRRVNARSSSSRFVSACCGVATMTVPVAVEAKT